MPSARSQEFTTQMRGPLPWCNWVVPGRVLAGAFPGSTSDAETEAALTALLRAGVNTFVCLQAEVDINVSEGAWRSGKALRCVLARHWTRTMGCNTRTSPQLSATYVRAARKGGKRCADNGLRAAAAMFAPP